MNTQRFLQIGLSLYIIAAPLAAQASVNAGSTGLGSGRLLPTTAAVAGLVGVIIGRQALRSAGRAGSSGSKAIVAMALGLIGLIIGGLHAANSAGSFGTGNGLAGAIVAIALGLVGIILGGLALARSRRN